MGRIVDVYTDAVYDNLKPLRANWEPAQPVQLGDFGALSGEAFQRLGNVSDQGIKIGNTITDDLQDQKIFSSNRGVSISFQAGGGVTTPGVSAKGSLSISFESKDSAFFNAAGCSYSIVADKVALANRIMDLYRAEKWKREWAVITDLVKSRSTTVVIASADNASIVLEATGNAAQIDLADANLGLKVQTSHNVGYQVIAKNDLTPLIGVSKIQSRFLWWGDNFKPLSTDMLNAPDLSKTLQDAAVVQSEPEEYLEFAQLM